MSEPKRGRPKKSLDEVAHGASRYANHGCRCDVCKNAHRIRVKIRLRERRDETPPDGSHGKASTYINWSCRCDLCTAAHTVRTRPYVEKYRRETLGQKPRKPRVVSSATSSKETEE